MNYPTRFTHFVLHFPIVIIRREELTHKMAHVKSTFLLGLTFTYFICSVCNNIPYNEDYEDFEGQGRRLGRYHILSADIDESDEKSRSKRYPTHLDPNIGSKFWIRAGECARSADGHAKYFCPFPHPNGRYTCLEEWELCDGVKNCPDASDENGSNCLFYRVTQAQLETLAASQRKYDQEVRSLDTDKIQWGPRPFN